MAKLSLMLALFCVVLCSSMLSAHAMLRLPDITVSVPPPSAAPCRPLRCSVHAGLP